MSNKQCKNKIQALNDERRTELAREVQIMYIGDGIRAIIGKGGVISQIQYDHLEDNQQNNEFNQLVSFNNLPSEFSEKRLRELAEKHGWVVCVSCDFTDSRNTKGLVVYENTGQADQAVAALQEYKIAGQIIRVNIEEIQNHYKKQIYEPQIRLDWKPLPPCQSGYIYFETASEMSKAEQYMKDNPFKGNFLECTPSPPSESQNQNPSLLTSNPSLLEKQRQNNNIAADLHACLKPKISKEWTELNGSQVHIRGMAPDTTKNELMQYFSRGRCHVLKIRLHREETSVDVPQLQDKEIEQKVNQMMSDCPIPALEDPIYFHESSRALINYHQHADIDQAVQYFKSQQIYTNYYIQAYSSFSHLYVLPKKLYQKFCTVVEGILKEIQEQHYDVQIRDSDMEYNIIVSCATFKELQGAINLFETKLQKEQYSSPNSGLLTRTALGRKRLEKIDHYHPECKDAFVQYEDKMNHIVIYGTDEVRNQVKMILEQEASWLSEFKFNVPINILPEKVDDAFYEFKKLEQQEGFEFINPIRNDQYILVTATQEKLKEIEQNLDAYIKKEVGGVQKQNCGHCAQVIVEQFTCSHCKEEFCKSCSQKNLKCNATFPLNCLKCAEPLCLKDMLCLHDDNVEALKATCIKHLVDQGQGGEQYYFPCLTTNCSFIFDKTEFQMTSVKCPSCLQPEYCYYCSKKQGSKVRHENTCQQFQMHEAEEKMLQVYEADRKPCPKCCKEIQCDSGSLAIKCEDCQAQWCWRCGYLSPNSDFMDIQRHDPHCKNIWEPWAVNPQE